jgi:hypothetical protein
MREQRLHIFHKIRRRGFFIGGGRRLARGANGRHGDASFPRRAPRAIFSSLHRAARPLKENLL